MPEIIINSDGNVPNYDALEAVAKFMLDNYRNRNTEGKQAQRTIRTQRGFTLGVEELPQDPEKSMCSCNFKVTTISR